MAFNVAKRADDIAKTTLSREYTKEVDYFDRSFNLH